MDEMTFQYKTNYSFYVDESDPMENMYHEEEWSDRTNILMDIKHAIKKLSERQLHKCLSACILDKSDEEKRKSFVLSSAYGYMAYRYAKTVNSCITSKQIEPLDVYARLFFHDAARYLAQLQISGWNTKADSLGDDILDAINTTNDNPFGVTDNGERVNPISWFIVDLFTLASDKWYIEINAIHPSKKSYKLYQRVLDEWDTTEPINIGKLNFILCELHLIEMDNKATYDRQMDDILGNSIENAIEMITNMVETGNHDDFAPRELKDMSVWLFPYEIFFWLKLREQAGIKNPKTFTHPLMNTPIAKMFLDIKEPLPYPTELPYAKELLEKLKVQCPNVEIPEWLEGNDEKTPTSQQSNDVLPEDFMK